MNKILRFSFLMLLLLFVATASAFIAKAATADETVEDQVVNVSAEYVNGKIVLTFADYANGGVAPGEGNIELQNEVGMTVARLINGSFGVEWNQVVYELSDVPATGYYKVVIPTGGVKGNMTNGFGDMSAIPASTCNVEIAEAGNTDIDNYLGNATMELVACDGVMVKYVFPDSKEDSWNTYKEPKYGKAATLFEEGVQVATSTFELVDLGDWNYVLGAKFDYTPVDGKQYSVVFASGCYIIYTMDAEGNVNEILEESPESTFNWTQGTTGDDDNPTAGDGWAFASVTPAEGAIESLKTITLGCGTQGGVNESVDLQLVSSNGETYTVKMYDDFSGNVVGSIIVDDPITADGTYTLTIPAGTFTSFMSGQANAEATYTWIIGEGASSMRQEEIFAKNNAVAEPIVIETDGVKMTTVATTFMDMVLDVSYNMNGEGKLNWKNGTSLVFTAKEKITGIVIEGDWTEFATANKGDYNKGVWTGTLEAGDVLTLTAGDGINVSSIVVLYNGAKYSPKEEEKVNVNIDLNITKTDWSTVGNDKGEVIGTVSCDATQFDHYEFKITCDIDPDVFISFSNLNAVSGNITCVAWEGGSYDLYNEYNYTLTVSAFDVPYFGAAPVATVTYNIVGTGKTPIIYNNELVATGLSLDPDDVTYLHNGYKANGSTFDVTFNAPVTKINAWVAMGFDGSKTIDAVKKTDDGIVWTITLPESLISEEGAINVMIQAWDARGFMARGWNGDHAFDYNILISPTDPNAVDCIVDGSESDAIYTLGGVRVESMKKGNVYIVNGKKVVK